MWKRLHRRRMLKVLQDNEIKYLGVTFTENLSCESHIDNIRIPRTWIYPTKIDAYKSLVRPILEYSAIVWNPHQSHLKTKLERIQSLALCFIYSRYSRYDRVTILRKRASISTLECRRVTMKFLFLLYHDCISITKDSYLKPPHHRSK